jgi:hypothetical protein
LGVIQIPNLAYAIAIATAFQATLHAAIAHHGIMPNNPDPIPTSINFSPQELNVTTANISPTIDAFANPVEEFFRVFELEFLVKSFEKNSTVHHLFSAKDETLKMLYKRLLKLKEDT